MAQAARRDDRETFDRLFDCCFGWVYAVAWRATHDVGRAEAITAYVLREAMNDSA
jgi:DNA-directed RNA polymerase specialized sigma24 family protein